MADLSSTPAPTLWARIDKAWAFCGLIIALVAVFDWDQTLGIVQFALASLWSTAPFILFAVLAIGGLKATGAEALIAKVFQGRQVQMIFLASLLGGLSPLCACEVIPFVSALLAAGAPLAAVMAFWLSSPVTDPAMFIITGSAIGWDFAIMKTAAAVGIGIMGGFATMAFAKTPVFADPIRPGSPAAPCCGSSNLNMETPVWKFWQHPVRRAVFTETTLENGLFLLKWLLLAYLLEAVMVQYVPASWIATVLGGDGLGPILLGAAVGAPAYLNGYAAIPLIGGLLDQGMSPGAAMSFVIAGGITCIPAAIAVWVLVKPRVFAAFLGYALIGAVLSGLIWSSMA
ncbi:permease [Algirhabdus cladophorae]|uniref:permease n=1 Tax=Algirhabdus cladophorae TaxID=3377108 RepID=UPI003B8472EF